MLELLSPKALAASPEHKRLKPSRTEILSYLLGIQKTKPLPGAGWNYALDHAWLLGKIERHLIGRKSPLILDVGCGGSVFHLWLERELRAGIVGMDRGPRSPIVDIPADIRVFDISQPAFDLIFWCSSIEHNPPDVQRQCVEASLRLLRPGGVFLATFSAWPTSRYYAPSEQWNLSPPDAEQVFGVPWSLNHPYFADTLLEYRADYMSLHSRHRDRYGTDDYGFLVGGAEVVKK